jgi:DNA-binding NarL/FixJ family response regulator
MCRSAAALGENMASVVLYTNNAVLAAGFRTVVPSKPGLILAGVGASLEEAVQTADAVNADVLLVDLTADLTIARMAAAHKRLPRCRLVLWTQPISVELAHQFHECGFRGILRKDASIDMMFRCLTKIAGGEMWFDRDLLNSLLDSRPVHISPREQQLVKLVSQGLSNKQIADSLFISEGTVKVYFSKLYRKLGVNDRFELALYGLRSVGGLQAVSSEITSSVLVRKAAG